MSSLPEGTGHIMCMAFLASDFRNLDLARKSILFLPPSPRGVSTIGVTATMATVAPMAPMPPTRGSIYDGGISGYPVIIRGLVMAGKCPSQGEPGAKPGAGLLPANPRLTRELLGASSSWDD